MACSKAQFREKSLQKYSGAKFLDFKIYLSNMLGILSEIFKHFSNKDYVELCASLMKLYVSCAKYGVKN